MQDNNTNNIKLKLNFEKRFKDIENDLQDSHLGIELDFYNCINETIGISNLIKLSKSIYIVKDTTIIDKDKFKQQQQIYSSQEYENMLEINEISNKLVFFCSSYLWNVSKHIKSLIKTYSINNCIVLCSMSELAHISHPHSITTTQQTFDKYRQQFINKIKSTFTSSSTSNNESSSSSDILPTITCEIKYFPLNYSQLFKNYFTIPVQKSFFPSNYFLNDLKLNEYKLNKMPETIQDDVHKTIHSFLSFCSELKLGSVTGEDLSIYPIGPFSNYLAHEISSTLSTVPAVQTEDYHPISLILIDRTLDLVGPSLHSENSMDRIYYSTTISSTTTTTSPVINIESFFDPIDKISSTSSVIECPKIISTISGYLDSNSNGSGGNDEDNEMDIGGGNGGGNESIWDGMIAKSIKDVIMILKRKLVEIISKENINVDISNIAGPINIQSLITLVNVLKSENQLLIYRYHQIIEAVSSIEQTVNNCSKYHWDSLLSIEKILLLSCGDQGDDGYEDDDNSDNEENSEQEQEEEPSILSQICDIIESPIGGGDEKDSYSIQQVLMLCTLAYSIKGLTSKLSQKYLNQLSNQSEQSTEGGNNNNNNVTSPSLQASTTQINLMVSTLEKIPVFSEHDEQRLIRCLKEKINKENVNNNNNNIVNIDLILGKLKSISIIRHKYLNDNIKSLIKGTGFGSSSYSSLTSQLVNSMFDKSTTNTTPFEKFNSSSLVGYLLGKTSWIGGRKKKEKPLDNRKVIIYILGGITFTEIKEINDLLDKSLKQSQNKEYSNHQFLIGSNQILTPLKLFNHLYTNK